MTAVRCCAALLFATGFSRTPAHALDQAVPFLPGALYLEQTSSGETVSCLPVNGFLLPVTSFESRAVTTEAALPTLKFRTRWADNAERAALRTDSYKARVRARRAQNACRRSRNPRRMSLPIIQSVRPRLLAPGTVVTVRGRNLERILSVRVADIGVPFTVVSPSELTFHAPRGLTRPGNITIASQRGSAFQRGTFGLVSTGYRTTPSLSHNKRFPADVTMDGVVDARDLAEVKSRLTGHWSRAAALSDPVRPDVDGDAAVTQGDLLGIKAYLEYLSLSLN